jgi:hypothetical protein
MKGFFMVAASPQPCCPLTSVVKQCEFLYFNLLYTYIPSLKDMNYQQDNEFNKQ